MENIGLDFGTTYSILSYHNKTSDTIECYRMGGPDGPMYIPSIVSTRKDDPQAEPEVGGDARLNLGDDDYKVYSCFKMLLGQKDTSQLEKYGFNNSEPEAICRLYIEKIIKKYVEDHRLNAPIENIVVTVPEIWIKEGNHISRECLQKICDDLKLPVKKILSEPVAACAYFLDLYHKEKGKWFNGHLLVCDYGGGTLDLSLAETENNKITVIECAGKGHGLNHLGQAGVAFDEATVSRVYEREHGKKLLRDNPIFYPLMREFEKRKIGKKNDIDKYLKNFIRQGTVDKKVFSVSGMNVMASDLVETFNEVIRPVLEDALGEMKSYCDIHGVNWEDSTKFQFVLVGGFCNFYLVQQTVLKVFESVNTTGKDPRSSLRFNAYDITLAISKGAALVANNVFDIDQRCPVSVGLQMLSDRNEHGVLRKADFSILKKGTKISKYTEATFIKGVKINLDHGKSNVPIIIFLGDGEQRDYTTIDKAINQLFPNTDDKDNQWNVGFSVNDNLLFKLHVRDAKGTEKITSLGDLRERVRGLVYVGE